MAAQKRVRFQAAEYRPWDAGDTFLMIVIASVPVGLVTILATMPIWLPALLDWFESRA